MPRWKKKQSISKNKTGETSSKEMITKTCHLNWFLLIESLISQLKVFVCIGMNSLKIYITLFILVGICSANHPTKPQNVKSREKRFHGPVDLSRVTRAMFSPETISLQMTFAGWVRLSRSIGFLIGGSLIQNFLK